MNFIDLYMVVLRVSRGPIGFTAPLSFKLLDSRPVESDMGADTIDFHDFRLFQKSCHGFEAWYSSCFRPNCRRVGFSCFSVETRKMRGEKLRRFVVVSPRGVPSVSFSWPFQLQVPLSFSCPWPPEKSVY